MKQVFGFLMMGLVVSVVGCEDNNNSRSSHGDGPEPAPEFSESAPTKTNATLTYSRHLGDYVEPVRDASSLVSKIMQDIYFEAKDNSNLRKITVTMNLTQGKDKYGNPRDKAQLSISVNDLREVRRYNNVTDYMVDMKSEAARKLASEFAKKMNLSLTTYWIETGSM
jgi:hypothetical protein